MLTKVTLELDPLQLTDVQNAMHVALVHLQATIGDIGRQVQQQVDADAKAQASELEPPPSQPANPIHAQPHTNEEKS